MKPRNLLLLLTCALSSSACPAVDREVVIRARGECLAEPPPLPTRVAYAGPEAGCPEAFVACLTTSSAKALTANLGASRLWEFEAWERCGPTGPDAGYAEMMRTYRVAFGLDGGR